MLYHHTHFSIQMCTLVSVLLLVILATCCRSTTICSLSKKSNQLYLHVCARPEQGYLYPVVTGEAWLHYHESPLARISTFFRVFSFYCSMRLPSHVKGRNSWRFLRLTCDEFDGTFVLTRIVRTVRHSHYRETFFIPRSNPGPL